MPPVWLWCVLAVTDEYNRNDVYSAGRTRGARSKVERQAPDPEPAETEVPDEEPLSMRRAEAIAKVAVGADGSIHQPPQHQPHWSGSPVAHLHGKSLGCAALDGVKTYVINLDRRADRLSRMRRALATQPQLCQSACRLEAVDGQQLSYPGPRVISAHVWAKAEERSSQPKELVLGGHQTRGSVALQMSHAEAWQHLADSGDPWAFIMEDDAVHFRDNAGDALCKLASGKLGFHWDWVKLSNMHDLDSEAPPRLVPGSDYGTAMYAIKRSAAIKLLEGNFPMQDLQLDSKRSFMRHKLKTKVMEPGVVWAPRSTVDTDVQITQLLPSLAEQDDPGCELKLC